MGLSRGPGGGCLGCYRFRFVVSVFVWGLGGMGSSGTSGGEEEGVGQDLEQARSG